MIPPCLTLSNIRHATRVKWSNPGKGVAPSPTPRCCSFWKGSQQVFIMLPVSAVEGNKSHYFRRIIQKSFQSKLYNRVDVTSITLTASSLQRSSGYDTKHQLMVRLQFWRSGDCGIPFHCYYTLVHSNPDWEYLLGYYLWIKLIS